MDDEIIKKIENLCAINDINFKVKKIEKHNDNYNGKLLLINNNKIRYRLTKVTPKKIGVFVAMWQPDNKNNQPYNANENIDLYVFSCNIKNKQGLFIFSKEIMITNNIISSSISNGKRGFRLYPPFLNNLNKQATKNQSWQIESYYDLDQDIDKIVKLFNQ